MLIAPFGDLHLKVQHALWYGVNYTTMNPAATTTTTTTTTTLSEAEVVAAWDGCSALPSWVSTTPNVNGIGAVSQVSASATETASMTRVG